MPHFHPGFFALALACVIVSLVVVALTSDRVF